ncbi:MAG: HeH/LEM domain-containing protein [Neisseria sp.]|nr:HeH/LEM domain-containing protein [Neisseria sp.]
MKLIYSKGGRFAGVEGRYRNPQYFTVAETAEEVLADADYPAIAAAYAEIGIEVQRLVVSEKVPETPSENSQEKQPDKFDVKKLNTDELKAALSERGIAFDARAKKADLLSLLEAAERGDD